MTNNIHGNPHQVVSWFFSRNPTSQKGMAWYIQSDEMEEPTTKNITLRKTFIQIWWRNQKLSRQAKVKRIQHHQTNFTTNAKGTFLDRKHKRRERPEQNTPETIKKMAIGSYISIINLHVNGLNAPTKRYKLTDRMKTCIYALPLTTSLYLTTQIVHNYFIWLS